MVRSLFRAWYRGQDGYEDCGGYVSPPSVREGVDIQDAMLFSKPYRGLDWGPIPFETLQIEIPLGSEGDEVWALHGNAFMLDSVGVLSCHIVPGMRRLSVQPTTMDGELDTFGLLQSPLQVSYGIENTQARSYCSVSVIFMGLGIAELDEKTIPEQLGNMSFIALDDSVQTFWYACTTSRYSSGSSWEESRVESTRSQNMTVSCRLSASGGGAVGRGSASGEGCS